MGKHLVLTVHGIGEQRPGETVDAVVGAATTRFVEDGKVTKAAEPVEIHRDLIELAETQFDGTPRNAELFPAHLRRVRRAGVDSSKDDTVFAEVYWADKSPAPRGPFWTAFDLMKVVLGLGYIAMDNVENNRTAPAIGVIHLFTWVFYGWIAPVNVLLILGAVSLLLDLTPLHVGAVIPVPALLAAVGAVGGGLGVWLHFKVAQTYLVRIFAYGLTVFSGLLIAAVLLLPAIWGADPVPALDAFLDVSLIALNVGWSIAVALAGLAYMSTLGFRKPNLPQPVEAGNTLYPAICAAMVMLWIVFSASMWLMFQQIVARLSTPKGHPHGPDGLLHGLLATHLEGVLSTLTLSAVSLAILLLTALGLVLLRNGKRQQIYLQGDWMRRVILNRAIRIVLGGFMIAMSVSVGSQILTEAGFLSAPLLVPEADGAVSSAILAAMLGVGVLIYNLPGVVAGALGVARDIVTYAVVRACLWRTTDLMERKKNYTLREAINDRFHRVLHYTLETVAPDHVTIISHSQGTVIATQMLQEPKIHALLAKHNVAGLSLVTMGSPVTHIYRHYFQEHFQVSHTRLPKGATWHNIHRADDFVGTTIDGALASDDMNLVVEAGGHTGYFTDHQVWRRLYNDVGFTLFR